jgi:hypothetical protein
MSQLGSNKKESLGCLGSSVLLLIKVFIFGGGNMKKVSLIMTVLMMFFAASNTVNAHPGRTDANGGHTCRTNCEKWGLKYGEYHYHNGGGFGGGSSSGSTSTVQPSGPSPEEIAEEREKSQGEKDGYAAGLKAGYEGKPDIPSPSGSYAYQEGYNAGYEKGYAEGAKKLEVEKPKARNEGYEFGKKSDSIIIPKKYQNNEHLKAAFEEGFRKAVFERDEAKKKEYAKLGYQDGIKDIKNEPKDVKAIYISAYLEGYEKGQQELKKRFFKQGYDAAFKMLEYKKPKLEKEKYIKWYKEGFESNKEVKKIQEVAFELGKNGENYSLPKEYAHAEPIFKHYYNLGLEENKKEKTQTTLGIGAIILGWIVRRFYVAKKMIN